jgi:hypothetical protein
MTLKNLFLGLLGGIAGGIIGGFICKFLATQNLYTVALPGALLGLGFAWASRRRHIVFGIICGILGLLAGLLTQWLVYSNNDTFVSLLLELKDYSWVTFFMLGLGAVFGFWFGLGRDSLPAGRSHSPKVNE